MKPTILIIEDDVELAHLLKHHLERGGRYAVEIARTGEEGLRALSQRHPSALILDVNLPEMNGFELCRRLRQESATRRLPILMLHPEAQACARQVVASALRLASSQPLYPLAITAYCI